nr:MAG TPA: hypothetical protein [Caudoviricetes sp.]
MSSVILRLLLWVIAVVVTVDIGVFVYNHLPDTVRDIATFVLIDEAITRIVDAQMWAVKAITAK